ncbi:hypothetical protein PAXRUDRAFT_27019 [Paxillus rubicundulus Ve08.2h10]|uniref:Uncharacterized protein n=1 Tax=Paxillus rubicundulus Ve08.2h10 TaxID=930991 RepID=A0A0D0DY88_9AGAM|nr:hypothetical protein PAXRUDRAFT_27019 [Paxillus rubicundulus Ve08.2h10]
MQRGNARPGPVNMDATSSDPIDHSGVTMTRPRNTDTSPGPAFGLGRATNIKNTNIPDYSSSNQLVLRWQVYRDPIGRRRLNSGYVGMGGGHKKKGKGKAREDPDLVDQVPEVKGGAKRRRGGIEVNATPGPSKRLRLGDYGGRATDFLDPFSPFAAPPLAFEPPYTVAESVAQSNARQTNGYSDLPRDLTPSLDGDEHETPLYQSLIDPSLCVQTPSQFVGNGLHRRRSRSEPPAFSMAPPLQLPHPPKCATSVRPASRNVPQSTTGPSSRAPSEGPSRASIETVPTRRHDRSVTPAASIQTLVGNRPNVKVPTHERLAQLQLGTKESTHEQCKPSGFSSTSCSQSPLNPLVRQPFLQPRDVEAGANGSEAKREKVVAAATTSASMIRSLVDSVAWCRSVLEVMSDNFAQSQEDMHAAQNEIKNLKVSNAKLKEHVKAHEEDITELQHVVELQEKALDHVANLLEDLKNKQLDPAVAKKAMNKATRNVKDNAFNILTIQYVVRKTFLHAMGIRTTNLLGTIIPLEDGQYWTYLFSRKAVVVRPNFEASWTENKEWAVKVAKYIRRKGTDVCPSYPADTLSGRSNTEIIKRLQAIFKTFKAQYRKLLDADPIRRVEAKMNGRRALRKIRKAKEQSGLHKKEPTLQDIKFDFMFTAAYQSTDESNDEGVLDPGTDSDGDNGAAMRPWTSCPPIYRSEEASLVLRAMAAFVRIREQVNAQRKSAKKGGAQKVGHTVIVGTQCERGLPRPGKKKIKIPCSMVSAAWLQENPDYDLPSLIVEDDEIALDREGTEDGGNTDSDDADMDGELEDDLGDMISSEKSSEEPSDEAEDFVHIPQSYWQ